jgi:hypothetical protein
MGLAGILMLGAYYYLQVSHSGGTRDVSPVHEEGELRRMSNEIEGLKRGMSLVLSAQAGAQATSTNSARQAPESPERSTVENLTHEEVEARAEESNQRYRQQIEVLFRRQYRDVAWADRTEQQIKTTIAELPAGTRADEVTCAATMCKVVVSHDDEMLQKGFPREIALKPAFQRSIVYAYDGLRTILYMMKESERFPRP